MESILSEIEQLGYHMTVKSDYVRNFAKDVGEIVEVRIYATGAIMATYYHKLDPNTRHACSLCMDELEVFLRYAKVWLKR